MEDKLILERHDAQIKTLFEQNKNICKKIEIIDEKINDMIDMRICINTMSVSLDYIIEHNSRQDSLSEKQNETLESINLNLSNLGQIVCKLEKGQGDLTKRVAENEKKHCIDLRDVEKKKYSEILTKYVFPIGGAAVIVMKILEFLLGS